MTKDTTQDPQGGTKKFLYKGPQRHGSSAFDDEVDDREWKFNKASKHANNLDNAGASSEFDLDGVWSIKKNVNATSSNNANSQKPGAQQGWSMNVGRGYYSRHGGLSDNSEFGAGSNQSSNSPDNRSQWGQQGKSFSYSYANNDTAGRMSQTSGIAESGNQQRDSPLQFTRNNLGGATQPNINSRWGGSGGGSGMAPASTSSKWSAPGNTPPINANISNAHAGFSLGGPSKVNNSTPPGVSPAGRYGMQNSLNGRHF